MPQVTTLSKIAGRCATLDDDVRRCRPARDVSPVLNSAADKYSIKVRNQSAKQFDHRVSKFADHYQVKTFIPVAAWRMN